MSPGVYVRERDRSSRRIMEELLVFMGRPGDIYTPPEPVPPPAPGYYLYGTGDNDNFQLLQPYHDNKYRPTSVPISDVRQFEAPSDDTIYAVKNDNTLWVWGIGQTYAGGAFGQPRQDFNLFHNVASSSIAPIQLPGEWTKVTGDELSMLGIKTDGTLWAWGYNFRGELGLGDTASRSIPVQVGTANDWLDISMAYNYSIGIRATGGNTVWNWGRINNSNVTTPIQSEFSTGWSKVQHGFVTYGLKTNGTLWSKGTSFTGRLGRGAGVTSSPTFGQIGSDTDWVSIGTSRMNATGFAIKNDGRMYYWGEDGVFGRPTLYTPTLFGTGSAFENYRWSYVCSQGYATLAVKTDGTLWGWDEGVSGILGYGGDEDVRRPLQVGTDTDWNKLFIFTGYTSNTFAIKTSGLSYSWGRGVEVFVGTDVFGYDISGSFTKTSTYTEMTGSKIWVSGSAYPEQDSYLAIDHSGSLWGWGDNSYGQLGVGDRHFTSSVRQVGNDTWKEISMGFNNAAGINKEDKLYTWGFNFYGQLGTTDDVDRLEPTHIETGSLWKSVAMGKFQSLAVRSDGRMFAWGSGSNGELGLGTDQSFTMQPIQVGGDTDWKSVYASDKVSFGIKEDGSLWGWGYNQMSVLGLGLENSYNTYNSPTQIITGSWKVVVSDGETTYALNSSGSLWGWGQNYNLTIPNGDPTGYDEGLSGMFSATGLLSGGDLIVASYTSSRITTTLNTCVTESLVNTLLGSASLTLSTIPTTGSNDNGYWELTLPFYINYNDSSYNTIYVSTNSYVTFGGGSFQAYPSANNPALNKIAISGYDNYVNKLYYGQEGNTFRIRYEGNGRYNNKGPSKDWEMVFYQNSSQIDIHVGKNPNWRFSADYEQPVPIEVDAGPWISIATSIDGGNQSLRLVKEDGTLWVQGTNQEGKLGTGDVLPPFTSPEGREFLTQVGEDTNYKQVFAGKYSTVVFKDN